MDPTKPWRSDAQGFAPWFRAMPCTRTACLTLFANAGREPSLCRGSSLDVRSARRDFLRTLSVLPRANATGYVAAYADLRTAIAAGLFLGIILRPASHGGSSTLRERTAYAIGTVPGWEWAVTTATVPGRHFAFRLVPGSDRSRAGCQAEA